MRMAFFSVLPAISLAPLKYLRTASTLHGYDVSLTYCQACGWLPFLSFRPSTRPRRSTSRATSTLYGFDVSLARCHACERLPFLSFRPSLRPRRSIHRTASTLHGYDVFLPSCQACGWLSFPSFRPSHQPRRSTSGPLLHCMAMTFSCPAAKHADGFLFRPSCHLTGPVEVPQDSFYTAWL